MLKSTSRWIEHYDLVIQSHPQRFGRFDIKALFEVLKYRAENKLSLYRVNKSTASYRVVEAEINENDGYFVLLIQHSDSTRSDPGFADLTTGASRIERKRKGEGIGFCGHLVVSLSETKRHHQSYSALLETIPGISRHSVERLLTHEFKQANAFAYKNRKGEQKLIRPIFELVGHSSTALTNALEEGHLLDVAYLSREAITDLDEAAYIKESERKIRVSLEPEIGVQRGLRLLNSLLGRAKREKASGMKVRYKEEDKTKTVDVDLTQDRIENTFFNRASLVKLDTPLDSLTPTLRRDLVTEMAQLL